MDHRKYTLILAFLVAVTAGKAQDVKSFDQADSTSNALLQLADWQQLIAFGERSINSGFDFPALRQRLGNAYMVKENYSAALSEFAVVFKNDSYNQTARYYAYLCHKYLNQEPGASYNAAYVDTALLKSGQITPYGLINAGLETGLKFAADPYRGNASYTRVSLSNRLSWRWQLEQSLVYFNQAINNNNVQVPGAPLVTGTADQQLEYYIKLNYSLTENLILIGAYHYLNTNYESVTYSNNIGIAGIKYTGTCFNLQADVNLGNMIGHHLTQYNAGLMLYPAGNLDFYTISRGSYLEQNGSGSGIFGQSVGYKVVKNTWAETSATFGNLDNYIDADGLYIYNAIDATKLKLGETIFYQLSKNAQLQLNYTYEQKQDDNHNLNYNQNSITAGLLWKF